MGVSVGVGVIVGVAVGVGVIVTVGVGVYVAVGVGVGESVGVAVGVGVSVAVGVGDGVSVAVAVAATVATGAGEGGDASRVSEIGVEVRAIPDAGESGSTHDASDSAAMIPGSGRIIVLFVYKWYISQGESAREDWKIAKGRFLARRERSERRDSPAISLDD